MRWPWPWPSGLDTQTWRRYGQYVPSYQKRSFYVNSFKSYSPNRLTHTHTHTMKTLPLPHTRGVNRGMVTKNRRMPFTRRSNSRMPIESQTLTSWPSNYLDPEIKLTLKWTWPIYDLELMWWCSSCKISIFRCVTFTLTHWPWYWNLTETWSRCTTPAKTNVLYNIITWTDTWTNRYKGKLTLRRHYLPTETGHICKHNLIIQQSDECLDSCVWTNWANKQHQPAGKEFRINPNDPNCLPTGRLFSGMKKLLSYNPFNFQTAYQIVFFLRCKHHSFHLQNNCNTVLLTMNLLQLTKISIRRILLFNNSNMTMKQTILLSTCEQFLISYCIFCLSDLPHKYFICCVVRSAYVELSF